MLIDDLLGRGTIGNTAADSGEVLGGDTEAIGIKRYLTLRETVFMNECDELYHTHRAESFAGDCGLSDSGSYGLYRHKGR